MELIAYLCVIALYCNIFGSGIMFLEFIRLEIKSWFYKRIKKEYSK